ncbi:hypothetical protein MBLNU459_g3936t1 [Dothideomycetes sp. NU459]
MTAVAPPLTFQQPSRTGWNSVSGPPNGLNGMTSEEMSRMFMPGPRKSAQRTNSSSSINSASSQSTLSASSAQTNGTTATADPNGWTTRKKPTRGIWPSGKAEPTAGLSTTRPQPVSTASSGPSAASAISALHAPMLPSQQMANGQTQQNGTLRNPNPEVPAILHLLPMNGTFERKTITVPFYSDVLRIGRQTNAKTAPTPTNGFFDSKVLSRQHAEIYAERNGRVYIRDVKSSNGTFVNGQRLSPENKESEPHELREQDVLELGIDIVSEDQKTVVHHKVAARVEHVGIYPQAEINFGEMDPNGQNGYISTPMMKRNGSQSSMQTQKANAMAQMAANQNVAMQQPTWSFPRFTPRTVEDVVKKLNRELNLAKQQSQDLDRGKQCLGGLLVTEPAKKTDKDSKSEKSVKMSPIKSKSDMKAHFSEPPAPPPQQPLPEKPDVAKALADPVIQPLLMRSETARPILAPNGSPTRADHSQALLILTQELKLAKDQIPSLEDRVKNLEKQLELERSARETAEERAQELEWGVQRNSDSAQTQTDEKNETSRGTQSDGEDDEPDTLPTEVEEPDLQAQLDRLHAAMDDMKQQMEAYRRRAETAESERDSVKQSLAEMIEQKRARNAAERKASRSRSRSRHSDRNSEFPKAVIHANGHVAEPADAIAGMSSLSSLLKQAGVEADKPLTAEQAVQLQRLLANEITVASSDSTPKDEADVTTSQLKERFAHHGFPFTSGFVVVILGMALMRYLDGWEKLQR